MKKILVFVFTGFGTVLTLLVLVGVVIDLASLDRTRGGYEPPHIAYTGQPINWDEANVTKAGVARRGYVLHALFDCTSGMISFEIFGQQIQFRKVSQRGIIVHKPREACMERGFRPEF